MLHVFLNPKRNINKIIKNILDNGDIEYRTYFPNDKNDLFNYEIVGSKSATSLSILSKVIFPKKFLLKFENSFNIHPGTKDYPGLGYNFALLNNELQYGAVCHYMEEAIDSGDIIVESNFDVSKHETIDSLQFKTYLHVLIVLNKFIENYRNNNLQSLPKRKWTRTPYLKKDFLNKFDEIEDEILKNKFMHYPDGKTPLVEKLF